MSQISNKMEMTNQRIEELKTNKNKITILGAGSFASAIATILTDKGYCVLLYTNDENQKKEIMHKCTNKTIFENLVFDHKVFATTDLKLALSFSEDIIIALPSEYIRTVLVEANKILDLPKTFINVSKGIEPDTNKLILEIIEEVINPNNVKGIAIVSGPSFAEGILDKDETALVCASSDLAIAKRIQTMLSNDKVRIYTSDDVIGVQVCGTVKNVLAIASGILTGMDRKENTRAALITRGLKEMALYTLAKGGKIETVYGLAGIGDLTLTASSTVSRNFQTGVKIGQGMNPVKAFHSSKTVVEGYRAAKAVYQDALKHDLDLPICCGVYEVFYEGKKPQQVMADLFERDLKEESFIKPNVMVKKYNKF